MLTGAASRNADTAKRAFILAIRVFDRSAHLGAKGINHAAARKSIGYRLPARRQHGPSGATDQPRAPGRRT
jgi:hypothetical protein